METPPHFIPRYKPSLAFISPSFGSHSDRHQPQALLGRTAPVLRLAMHVSATPSRLLCTTLLLTPLSYRFGGALGAPLLGHVLEGFDVSAELN
jgi:hypothetical protein